MIENKVQPQAREIEEEVLGAVMMYPNCLPDVVNLMFADVFYVDSHKIIYKSILRLYDNNRSIDILSVIEELRKMGELKNDLTPHLVTKITNNVVSTANIENHCRIVLQMFLKRKAIEIGMKFTNDGFDVTTDAFEIYDKADNEILKTQEMVIKGSVKDMAYYSTKVFDEYHTVKETGVLGLNTGIEPIDTILSGLVAPDLLIIAARPAMGKTALALSITHNLSVLNNVPCAWFSLEMDGVQLARRLASMDSDIPHEAIRHGKIYDAKEKSFFQSIQKVGKAPIYIEDKPNVNIRSIRTRANILVRKHGVKYIIIDYLQLMNGVDARNNNRNDIIGEISRGLKCLAKELNVPVIALSQLSREVEKRADKMPQNSDLRESGAIEQDADSILFLMRPEAYGFLEPVNISQKEYSAQGLCIGKIGKNRHGEIKNFPMSFVGNCMKFATHEFDTNKLPQYNYSTENPF